MIPELGQFALLLALLASFLQGVMPLIGAVRGNPRWLLMGRSGAMAFILMIAVAFVLLTWCFFVTDFSVRYVADHSNSQLPLMYRLGAVWGGHEGSLLLWLLVLSGWSFAVALRSHNLDPVVAGRVLGVLGLLAFGLTLFVVLTSNPFERLFPAATEGIDLNPMLQDPGLMMHPPMLYMGYVGFSVAFAFSVAALISGELNTAWARWSRPWTMLSWIFLTMGIMLGSYWAYYVLGWGGWWFWDPVENASFMPWLAGTALLHSLIVTEKRGGLRMWTVFLAILTFSLSLVGTFLVRSGVLTSVHAFASDPQRGIFILILLAMVVIPSLVLFAIRAPFVAQGGEFRFRSRETAMLIGNILLVVACATVMLGTLYPLISDALQLGKFSVGPPYFDAVFVPIMLPLLLLVAMGPLLRWKRALLTPVFLRLLPIAIAAFIGAFAISWWMGGYFSMVIISLSAALLIIGSGCMQIAARLRAGAPTPAFWGMQLAHMGIAIFVIGVSLVGGYAVEKDVRMAPNETVQVGGYEFLFRGVQEVAGPNYRAIRGEFLLLQEGKSLRSLHPEKRHFFSSAMPMTETAIDRGLTRDLYLALGEPLEDGAWAVRVYYKPFVNWIWAGCIMMAAGGVLVLIDRRYRLYRQKKAAPIEEVATRAMI